MAPRDFSQDGAAGAFGGNGASAPGGGIGPQVMSDPGPSALAAPSFSGGDISSFSMPSPPSGLPTPLQAPGPAIPEGIGPQDTTGLTPWGAQFKQKFSEGGSMPDTSDPAQGQDLVSLALTTVDSALQYGRQKYGLGDDGSGGGQQMAMNDQGFRKSDNIEDRRDRDPTQGQAPSSNFRTNADRVGDKINDVQSGYNPASQSLGINNIKPMAIPYPGDGGVGSQGPGPQGADQQDQQGAIPTDDEQETA